MAKEQKVLMTNLGGIAAVTAWGVANWDYFANTPQTGNEGWFSKGTKEGGADKCAHFYFSYAFSHLLSNTYENWGYTPQKSALLGAFSSFSIMTYMEVGDSFSDYGFSHEDFIMNLLGAATGYWLYTHPDLAQKVDFRIEYVPTFEQTDFISDYDHMKFLVAVKLEGFEAIKNPLGKYLELHLGYYARGYSEEKKNERSIYVGVGINLSKIFRKFSMKKTAKFLNYYQPPYTYGSLDRDLND